MSKRESKSWRKNKDLPYIETGLHDGFPFSEDFPPNAHGGVFEIVTSWGERLKGATVANLKTFNTVTDPPVWDISKCKLRKNSRAGINRRKELAEMHVAGWRRTN